MKGTTDMLLLIRGLDRLYDQCIDATRQTHGLSQIEIVIISFLYNNPSRDTAGDIALLRMRPKGNVSQGVESLIRKGLITRIPDREDRRKIHLKLTELAAPIMAEIDEVRRTYHRLIYRGFSEEELRTMSAFGDRMMENLLESLERRPVYEQQ